MSSEAHAGCLKTMWMKESGLDTGTASASASESVSVSVTVSVAGGLRHTLPSEVPQERIAESILL